MIEITIRSFFCYIGDPGVARPRRGHHKVNVLLSKLTHQLIGSGERTEFAETDFINN